MVLGGMIGFPEVLTLCLWSFVAGGIVAICKMVFVTGVKERLFYLLRYVRDTGRSGKIVPYRKPGRRPENFPFAVPVFAAAVLVVGKYAHILVWGSCLWGLLSETKTAHVRDTAHIGDSVC
jgi:hypothetical protein